MIFIGDIASPTEEISNDLSEFFNKHKVVFNAENVVANLEGLLSEEELIRSKTPVLYNHVSALTTLKRANVRAVMLANNHTLDLPRQFAYTSQQLSNIGIKWTGAGDSRDAAVKPVHVQEGNSEIILFNFCWNFLLYHQKNPSVGVHLAEINEVKILEQVKQYRVDFPHASFVVYFHWSFDLETLPFPLYREFSKELIDCGVDVVVGCHSHCIQGGEKYRDGYIVYGLGNFFIPNGVFANGQLIFPDWAREEWAFQWNPKTKQATCHWFEYEQNGGKHTLVHNGSELFESSRKLKLYSPYAGMANQEYVAYFKKHRRKRFLIPVFTDHRKTIVNKLMTTWLQSRARFARALAKLKIIRWQR